MLTYHKYIAFLKSLGRLPVAVTALGLWACYFLLFVPAMIMVGTWGFVIVSTLLSLALAIIDLNVVAWAKDS